MFGLMMLLMFNMLDTTKPEEEMAFSDFMYQLKQGEVAEVAKEILCREP